MPHGEREEGCRDKRRAGVLSGLQVPAMSTAARALDRRNVKPDGCIAHPASGCHCCAAFAQAATCTQLSVTTATYTNYSVAL
jgi:hypothetical protein